MASTTLPNYSPGMAPLLPEGDTKYLQAELQRLNVVLNTYQLMLPQAATALPKKLLDAMPRLARAPWWPVSGQAADAWVYYDAPTQTWLFL